MNYETIEYRGFNINLHYDEFADSPRDMFEPLGKIVCVKNLVNWADEYSEDQSTLVFDTLLNLGYETEMIHDDLYSDQTTFIEKYYPKLEKLAIVLPVQFYDYGSSGCKLSVVSSFDEDSTGFIYISKVDARKEYGRLTKKQVNNIIRYLTGEVKEYSSWLSGEVYGYTVEPKDTNKGIYCDDSCWGFYGETDYMISEAKSNIDHAIKEYKKEAVREYKERKEYNFTMYVQSFAA